MVYSNDDPRALYAMERARTGNYGADYDDGVEYVCPVCGALEPEHYYLDDDEECIGCSECVHKTDFLYWT